MKKILRSVGAVVAGFVAVVVLSILTDVILEKTGVLPPPDHPELSTDGLLALAAVYRTLYTILGGWVTARLAADRPMAHAVWLGGLGTLAGIAGCFAFWNFGHHWYPVLLAAEGLPCTMAGAWLYMKGKRG